MHSEAADTAGLGRDANLLTPMSWSSIRELLEFYKLGDISSIAGLLISLIGFALSIAGIKKAQGAAEAARIAANATKAAIQTFETVIDFSESIALVDEIKRNHRKSEWGIAPENYARLRKVIINLRASRTLLDSRQSEALREILTDLYELERLVENSRHKGSKINILKVNSSLAKMADGLLTMLADLKAAQKELL